MILKYARRSIKPELSFGFRSDVASGRQPRASLMSLVHVVDLRLARFVQRKSYSCMSQMRPYPDVGDCNRPDHRVSFPKIRSGRIRAVRENQTIIRCDVCDHLPAWNIYRRSAQVATPALS